MALPSQNLHQRSNRRHAAAERARFARHPAEISSPRRSRFICCSPRRPPRPCARRHGHHRRDSCARPHQARSAPGALAGAAASAGQAPHPAHRPLCHPTPLEEVARFLGGIESHDRKAALALCQGANSVLPKAIRKNSRLWHQRQSTCERRRGFAVPDPVPCPCARMPRFATVPFHRHAGAPKRLKLRIEVLSKTWPGSANRKDSLWAGIADAAPRVDLECDSSSSLEIIASATPHPFVNSARWPRAGRRAQRAGCEPIARAITDRLPPHSVPSSRSSEAVRFVLSALHRPSNLASTWARLTLSTDRSPPPWQRHAAHRARGHHVDAVSEGILFPSTAPTCRLRRRTRAMHEGHIESTRFPRNPLDVSRSSWWPSLPSAQRRKAIRPETECKKVRAPSCGVLPKGGYHRSRISSDRSRRECVFARRAKARSQR